ncbi:MAG: NAD(P)/FAD-dependent oxidoreductase [Pseudomonadota bacterium]
MITIVGAGPAGCLLALLLARRGQRVTVYERRPDPGLLPSEAGRSINLALAARGIRALRDAGVMEAVTPLLTPMRGRRLHDISGTEQFLAYGQSHEMIYSVSRADLTRRLTEAARAQPGVALHFNQQCLGYADPGKLQLRDTASGSTYEVAAQRIVAADGAGSVLRQSLAQRQGFIVEEDRLEHDYKELTLPVVNGHPPLAMDALHIWPRGGFMLIALPNADGSFTATLFLPRSGPQSFELLSSGAKVRDFFAREFPDALPLVPDLAAQFAAHPQGMLGTIHSPGWRDAERLLLIGDAAHAIVPFHGQGMNCAFEDCRILDGLLAHSPDDAFEHFEAQRRGDCEAIATMALENYAEMRDTVRDPGFQQQKDLAIALERSYPDRFIPRYSMVMFHDEIPYSLALERGRVQQGILNELASRPAADPQVVANLIRERLPALSAAVQ